MILRKPKAMLNLFVAAKKPRALLNGSSSVRSCASKKKENMMFNVAAGRGGVRKTAQQVRDVRPFWDRLSKDLCRSPAPSRRRRRKTEGRLEGQGECQGYGYRRPRERGKIVDPGPESKEDQDPSVRRCPRKSIIQKVWQPSCKGSVADIPQQIEI